VPVRSPSTRDCATGRSGSYGNGRHVRQLGRGNAYAVSVNARVAMPSCSEECDQDSQSKVTLQRIREEVRRFFTTFRGRIHPAPAGGSQSTTKRKAGFSTAERKTPASSEVRAARSVSHTRRRHGASIRRELQESVTLSIRAHAGRSAGRFSGPRRSEGSDDRGRRSGPRKGARRAELRLTVLKHAVLARSIYAVHSARRRSGIEGMGVLTAVVMCSAAN